ncbi:12627_t:CDS:2, partial [Cetraspora pellucida]
MSKPQTPVSAGTNRLETNANTSINVPSGRSVSFSPEQTLHRNYGSLFEHFQSFGRENLHNERELSKSHSNVNEDPNSSEDGFLYSRRGSTFPLRLPLNSNTHSNARRISRNHTYSTTPGSYLASFSSDKVPWNALRYYHDSFSPTYDENFEDPALLSPNYDDGGSISSVIMDDGSLQRRRISLTSEHSSSDSDSERVGSDKQNSCTNSFSSYLHRIKSWLQTNLLTLNHKNIIKCALAYFLASLLTYVPHLNEFCGFDKSYNSHLVATVSVFFDPAKSFGGIYEAVFYAIIGGIYGMSVSVGSMLCAVWFNEHDMNILGHIISVVFWCGGSMFIVAFSKAKLNKASFNSACSLANIIIFISITREGGPYIKTVEFDLIFQVTKIILFGVLISFLVSVIIWPVSASKKLGNDIGKTLDSFRLLLKLLTKTFLVDDINYTDKSVQSAIESYRGTFTSLRESLRQASLEIHNGNMQRKIHLYGEVVESLTRLAQHLELIHYVGPPMKSLAYTCKQTLFHLQEQFTETDKLNTKIRPSFTVLRQNLHSALELFEKSQSRALTKLYKQRTAKSYFDDRPNEEVFLIYFFVFNLQEFTRELSYLVDLTYNISRIDANEQKRREGRKWWQFWRYSFWFSRDTLYNDNAKNKFPENTHNLFDTIHTPKPKTLPQKIAIKLWQSFSWFRQFEVKYAVKAAVSAAILASPAFIESTRDIYTKYRGEWVCITMMVVMVPTVGGTNLMGIYRLLGTLLGCYLAWMSYLWFPN